MRCGPTGAEQHASGHVALPKGHRFPERVHVQTLDRAQVGGCRQSIRAGANNCYIAFHRVLLPKVEMFLTASTLANNRDLDSRREKFYRHYLSNSKNTSTCCLLMEKLTEMWAELLPRALQRVRVM